MKVVIVGAGEVGFHIASHLAGDNGLGSFILDQTGWPGQKIRINFPAENFES